jgi:hypothetical protein
LDTIFAPRSLVVKNLIFHEKIPGILDERIGGAKKGQSSMISDTARYQVKVIVISPWKIPENYPHIVNIVVHFIPVENSEMDRNFWANGVPHDRPKGPGTCDPCEHAFNPGGGKHFLFGAKLRDLGVINSGEIGAIL